jgi:hypothetical protein
VFLWSLLPLPQVLAFRADGFQSPPSNEDLVTMPSMPAPILTSAQAWGHTTGQATATAPEGVTFTQASQIAKLAADAGRSAGIHCSTPADAAKQQLLAAPGVSRAEIGPLVSSAVEVHGHSYARRPRVDGNQPFPGCAVQGLDA